MTLNKELGALCDGNDADFSGLSAVILNCSLKRPEEKSHTDLLLSVPAEILIIGTPICLGEESSVCRLMIERLYAMSAIPNDQGQNSFYGKVGGAVITGNEDGIKHCAMSIPYALGHLG